MNELHESNRACWNGWAKWWGRRRDEKGVWNSCHRDPSLVLSVGEMQFLASMRGKSVCVLASGDNEVVFALAGLGARVTSVDISEGQLEIAEERARSLDLEVHFLRSDVTELTALADDAFDAVHTGGGVAVWISDLQKYYAEATRILKPDGILVVNEFHPFGPVLSDETPWNELHDYSDRGPFVYTTNEGFKGDEHHWTVADHIRAALDAGCEVVKLEEHDGTVADRVQDEIDAREEKKDARSETHLPKLPRFLLIVARKPSANGVQTDARTSRTGSFSSPPTA